MDELSNFWDSKFHQNNSPKNCYSSFYADVRSIVSIYTIQNKNYITRVDVDHDNVFVR